MKGFFACVSETFSWVGQQIDAGFSAVKYALSELSALSYLVLSSDTVRSSSYEWFVKFWAGFSVPWHPNVVPALLSSPKTTKALGLSFWHNIFIYGGPVLCYEISKNWLHYYYPDTEDSWTEYGVDWCAFAYFMNMAVSRTLDNMLGLNQAIATAAYEENADKDNMTPCSHNDIAKIQGAIAEPIYYLSDVGLVKTLNAIMPFKEVPLPFLRITLNKLLTSPFKALLLGRSMADYKYGMGKCTAHRDRLYSQNKAYLLGFGLSLLVFVEAGNYLVKRYSNVESIFLDDAITNFIAQYFIFVAFTRDQVLPVDEKKHGADFFYYNRLMTTSWTKQFGEVVIPRIANPHFRGPLIRAIQYVYRMPITGWVAKKIVTIVVPSGFRTVKGIATQPGIKLFLQYKHKQIEEGLKGFEAFRDSYGATILIYLPNVFVPENIQNLIKCAMRDEWKQVLEFVRYALSCANFDPEPANVILHVSKNQYQKILDSSKALEILPRMLDEPIQFDDEDFIKIEEPISNQETADNVTKEKTVVAGAEQPAFLATNGVFSLPGSNYPDEDELAGIVQVVESEPEKTPISDKKPLWIVEDYVSKDSVKQNQYPQLSSSKNSLFYLQQVSLTSKADGNLRLLPSKKN